VAKLVIPSSIVSINTLLYHKHTTEQYGKALSCNTEHY